MTLPFSRLQLFTIEVNSCETMAHRMSKLVEVRRSASLAAHPKTTDGESLRLPGCHRRLPFPSHCRLYFGHRGTPLAERCIRVLHPEGLSHVILKATLAESRRRSHRAVLLDRETTSCSRRPVNTHSLGNSLHSALPHTTASDGRATGASHSTRHAYSRFHPFE